MKHESRRRLFGLFAVDGIAVDRSADVVEVDADLVGTVCTNYPPLIPLLTEVLLGDVRLVDSATTCAGYLKKMLEEMNLLSGKSDEENLEIHLSNLSKQFEELAKRFLRRLTGRIRRAVLVVG